MAVAWSWAFDTPFKWTKQIASHFGGTRQGLAISWPARIKDAGGIRHQFHHIIDIVPTILEAAGLKSPQMVDGIKQKPIEGVSMAYTFDKKNADAPSKRTTQYFEMIANRGIYHEGWYACTTPPHGPWILNAPLPAPQDYKWELYNLKEDFTQADDLAAKNPAKLKELQAIWQQEAVKYNVLPLDNDTFARALAPRPSATAGKTQFTYKGVNPGINSSNAPNILGKSYKMTAESGRGRDGARAPGRTCARRVAAPGGGAHRRRAGAGALLRDRLAGNRSRAGIPRDAALQRRRLPVPGHPRRHRPGEWHTVVAGGRAARQHGAPLGLAAAQRGRRRWTARMTWSSATGW